MSKKKDELEELTNQIKSIAAKVTKAQLVTYSPEEAAERLQITRRTLYSWIKERKLPAVKVGRRWIITEETLRKVLSNGLDKPEEKQEE